MAITIYEWRCGGCQHLEEVERKMADYLVGPDYPCPECKVNEWTKILSKASVPFETLKDQGIFERIEKW